MAKTLEYNNGEVTVLWTPELCIHSGICVAGLPEVFRPNERPWIQVEAATSQKIINQVKQCPSGALAMKSQTALSDKIESSERVKINIIENGPMIVLANMEITKSDGTKDFMESKATFCRCGSSNNKPYCDGSHNSAGFIG